MKRLFIYRGARCFLVLTLLLSSLSAIDLPQFYRAPFFHGAPRQDQRNWTSFIDVRYGHGKADKGWNNKQDRVPILGIYGPTNVNLLGSNVASITPECTPLSHTYLHPKTGIIPSFNFRGNDGKIRLRGTFDIEEIDITYQQNLFWGLYAMAYFPFRDMKVTDICIENLTCPLTDHADTFQEFLDETFDCVLAEHGIKPARTPFNNSGIGDPAFYLGWQGYTDKVVDLVRDITGSVQLGAILPLASRRSRTLLSSLPLGYDGHWAASAKFAVEAGLVDIFAIGVNGGVNIYWTQTRCEPIKTDLCQRGIIFLGRERIEVLPGLLWNLGAYFHLDRPFKGLHVYGGYSYTKRDRTRVDKVACDEVPLADTRPVSTCFCDCKDQPHHTECARHPQGVQFCPTLPLTKRETIKRDERLREWQYHTLHIMATYDFHDHFRYGPFVVFHYDVPIDGTRTFDTDMIGGTGGLTLSWGF